MFGRVPRRSSSSTTFQPDPWVSSTDPDDMIRRPHRPSHAPPGSLTMASVTHDHHGAQHDGGPAEDRRQAALAAFLGADMSVPPSAALLVQALADARRAVAAHEQRAACLSTSGSPARSACAGSGKRCRPGGTGDTRPP